MFSQILSARYLVLCIILLAGMIWSTRARKLTMPAAFTGGVIGFLVFAGAGFTGLLMMTLFFLLGTGATSWMRSMKEGLGLAEAKSGRTAGQVMANAGVGGICGLLILLMPVNSTGLSLMMAASFSSAAADTVSSELGSVYGSRYFNILTWKKDMRGLNGVVSLEGTLLGIVASAAIALVYALGFGFNVTFLLIVLSGTLGNLADSILGATLERRRVLNNDAVNFLNTLLAALAAAGLFYLLA